MISSSPAEMLLTANRPRGEEGVAPLTTIASEMRAPWLVAHFDRWFGLAVTELIVMIIMAVAVAVVGVAVGVAATTEAALVWPSRASVPPAPSSGLEWFQPLY